MTLTNKDTLEEELQAPIDSPSEIMEYQNTETGHIYQFQIFPNLGTFKKFESPLITNYVVTTVRLGSETIYGRIIMPKTMERIISKLTRLEE